MSQRFFLRNAMVVESAYRRRLAILAVVVGLAAKASSVQAHSADSPQETWYVYRIAGKDIGRIHETVHPNAHEVITTVETLIIFNRLGSKVEIKGTDIFTEGSDGYLRSAHSEMSSSRQTTTLDASVEKDKVLLRVSRQRISTASLLFRAVDRTLEDSARECTRAQDGRRRRRRADAHSPAGAGGRYLSKARGIQHASFRVGNEDDLQPRRRADGRVSRCPEHLAGCRRTHAAADAVESVR